MSAITTGTVIFTMAAKLAGGSKRTAEFTKRQGKPLLHIFYTGSYERLGERLAAFVRENNIKSLNVAASRGSKEPKVVGFVKETREDAFYSRSEAIVLR